MKINEIVTENKRPLRKASKQALPNMTSYDQIANGANPYMSYRFGVLLARSPSKTEYTEGPTGSAFTMIDYTDADAQIRKAAAREMGLTPSTSTGKGSEELLNTNTASPVAKIKKNKYGV